jgi:hypothetical protein
MDKKLFISLFQILLTTVLVTVLAIGLSGLITDHSKAIFEAVINAIQPMMSGARDMLFEYELVAMTIGAFIILIMMKIVFMANNGGDSVS